jgi:pimeloyl-ACP methyl ester carboxylesterase
MSGTEWRVAVGTEETRAVYEPPSSGAESAVFVCAHGAGGHQDDAGMVRAARSLEAVGFTVVRFNFPYREKGSGRPDPMPVLKASVAEAVARARKELAPRRLVIGGRSMGGRAASMLAADGYDCDGLLLLAYPLHPAGQPGKPSAQDEQEQHQNLRQEYHDPADTANNPVGYQRPQRTIGHLTGDEAVEPSHRPIDRRRSRLGHPKYGQEHRHHHEQKNERTPKAMR